MLTVLGFVYQLSSQYVIGQHKLEKLLWVFNYDRIEARLDSEYEVEFATAGNRELTINT